MTQTNEKQCAYRLYTENKNLETVLLPIFKKCFDCFTLVKASGYWQGINEGSIIFEVISEDSAANDKRLQEISARICRENKQECCLITKQAVEVL